MIRRALVIVENQPYPYDPRLRAQVSALVGTGAEVTVVGPTAPGFGAAEERDDAKVRVLRYRAPTPGRGIAGYLREYGLSLLRLARLLRRVRLDGPFDVVLVCNPPDVLAVLAAPFARRGAGVVFDARELSPELFEVKFGRRGVLHRLSLASERLAFRRSDAVLVTNPSYAANVHGRGGVDPERVFVVGNGPDPARIFPVEPRPELRRGRTHLVLWMGAMSRQDGLEVVVEAADELVRRLERTDVTLALVGPGDVNEAIEAEVRRRGLEGVVVLTGPVDDDGVRAYLATADVCVNVDVPNPMNDRAAMRKVLEYLAAGRAVVQFPLTEMQRLCGDATEYARPGDARDLADRIALLLDDPERRRNLESRARRRVEEMGLLWPHQVPAFLSAVELAVRRATGLRRSGGP